MAAMAANEEGIKKISFNLTVIGILDYAHEDTIWIIHKIKRVPPFRKELFQTLMKYLFRYN